MPWRFRRSFKVLPGVRANMGTRGPSLTVGGKGFKTTFGHGRIRRTFSIPGTGLSNTESTPLISKSHSKAACCPLALLLLPFFAIQGIGYQSTSFLRKTYVTVDGEKKSR